MEIIAIAVSAIVGLLVAYFQWSFKTAVLDRIDKLSLAIEEIKKESVSFREKVIGEYALNVDMEKFEVKNDIAHKELRQEMNYVRERVARVEK